MVVTFGARRGGPWSGRIMENQGQTLVLGVTPTPDAIVGKFRTYVAIVAGSGLQRTKRDPQTDLYVLYNAWCPGTTLICHELRLTGTTDDNISYPGLI